MKVISSNYGDCIQMCGGVGVIVRLLCECHTICVDYYIVNTTTSKFLLFFFSSFQHSKVTVNDIGT